MMKLKGKTAFVTGGNRGIGFEVCRQLAEEGASVLLGSRDANKGEQAAVELRNRNLDVSHVSIDVSDGSRVREIGETYSNKVDVLINNAAILDRVDVLDLAPVELENVIRTNLIGPIQLSGYLAKGMLNRNWGRIVNVSSGMGAISRGLGSDSAAYRISKLALNGFTISLANALRGTGVLVNSVDPGWVRTAMGGASAPRSPQEGAQSIVYAALLPDRGPTGVFFRNGRKVDW